MASDLVNTPPAAIDSIGAVTEPSAPANATVPTPPRPTRPIEEPHEDPQVASLHAIFPDFDPVVLQSVLDSVSGDQDRAVDKLLGMSDPEYEEHHVPDQTELDEQFARRLMLEDQERQSRRRHTARGTVPSQPRTTAPDHAAQDQSGNTAKADFQEVTETFSRIAETGKKTFSSLFSKVKAKMQELDQSRNDSDAIPGSQFSPGPSHQDRHSMMQQSYYDPNFQTHEEPAPPSHVQGYDITAVESTRNADGVKPLSVSPESPQHSSDTRGLSSSPQRSSIDPSKLGLLPKRPVSLISTSPPPKITGTNEGEDLEYVENPFEEDERRK